MREVATLRLAQILETAIGLRTSPDRLQWLAAAAGRTGYGVEGLLEELGDGSRPSAALDRLIDEVTVDESAFFRHATELEAIDWVAAADSARAAGREEVRVWSAACARGEEAYTLAILAAERAPAAGVSVLGTDISVSALKDARRGRYGTRALRLVPEEIMARWFLREGAAFEVTPELRRSTRFARHNIARGPWLPEGESPFDVVVCRNALIYFGRRALLHAAEALDRALEPGGQLVLGAADRLCVRRGTDRAPARRKLPAPAPRPIAADPPVDADDPLGDALAAAQRDPGDAEAHFAVGLLQLAEGDAAAAVAALRRALYVDPSFALAAFQLGRAYDAKGDEAAAERAYRRTLATLDPADPRAERMLGGLDVADVASACRSRLS